MKKVIPNGRQGFTLIETLVVVSVLGIIMTTVISIMLNSFKAKGRTDITNRLEQSASYLTMELRRKVLNAEKKSIVCPGSGVGSSMAVINKFDGQPTVIECDQANSRVASVSASGTFNLSGLDVGVSGCANFISCDTLPVTGEVGTVKFNFGLYSSTGGSAVDTFVQRTFENTVVVRN